MSNIRELQKEEGTERGEVGFMERANEAKSDSRNLRVDKEYSEQQERRKGVRCWRAACSRAKQHIFNGGLERPNNNLFTSYRRVAEEHLLQLLLCILLTAGGLL
jgi:hypothetical protein